ncbi:MAG: LysM peptidoglycan-binding domain-containing protein, partial [Planctomycetales bacterium]|nr:LysM peptidoglycan-binding domain-containing protein [Planctomycetales bacterium]
MPNNPKPHKGAWDARGIRTGANMRRYIYFASTLIVFLACLAIGPAYADDGSVYVVRPGDTLIRIAARHGLTASQLAAANGLSWDAWVY